MIKGIVSLQKPVHYEIKVAGSLDTVWKEWIGENATFRRQIKKNSHISVISGTFDQAALLGLLRKLYSHGYALISVNHIE